MDCREHVVIITYKQLSLQTWKDVWCVSCAFEIHVIQVFVIKCLLQTESF